MKVIIIKNWKEAIKRMDEDCAATTSHPFFKLMKTKLENFLQEKVIERKPSKQHLWNKINDRFTKMLSG